MGTQIVTCFCLLCNDALRKPRATWRLVEERRTNHPLNEPCFSLQEKCLLEERLPAGTTESLPRGLPVIMRHTREDVFHLSPSFLSFFRHWPKPEDSFSSFEARSLTPDTSHHAEPAVLHCKRHSSLSLSPPWTLYSGQSVVEEIYRLPTLYVSQILIMLSLRFSSQFLNSLINKQGYEHMKGDPGLPLNLYQLQRTAKETPPRMQEGTISRVLDLSATED